MLNNYRTIVIAIFRARQQLRSASYHRNFELMHQSQTALIHLYEQLTSLVINREFNSQTRMVNMVRSGQGNGCLLWVQVNGKDLILSNIQYLELKKTMSREELATHMVTSVDPDLADCLRDILGEYSSQYKSRKLKVG